MECRLILHARKAEQVGIREGLAVEYSIHVLGSDACARVGGGGGGSFTGAHAALLPWGHCTTL